MGVLFCKSPILRVSDQDSLVDHSSVCTYKNMSYISDFCVSIPTFFNTLLYKIKDSHSIYFKFGRVYLLLVTMDNF